MTLFRDNVRDIWSRGRKVCTGRRGWLPENCTWLIAQWSSKTRRPTQWQFARVRRPEDAYASSPSCTPYTTNFGARGVGRSTAFVCGLESMDSLPVGTERELGQVSFTSTLRIDRSVSGEPWRWRREPQPEPGMDDLVDELLLARGVPRDDLARHRDPRIRDFLPDPSCFQDMDKGAKRLADAVGTLRKGRGFRRL